MRIQKYSNTQSHVTKLMFLFVFVFSMIDCLVGGFGEHSSNSRFEASLAANSGGIGGGGGGGGGGVFNSAELARPNTITSGRNKYTSSATVTGKRS